MHESMLWTNFSGEFSSEQFPAMGANRSTSGRFVATHREHFFPRTSSRAQATGASGRAVWGKTGRRGSKSGGPCRRPLPRARSRAACSAALQLCSSGASPTGLYSILYTFIPHPLQAAWWRSSWPRPPAISLEGCSSAWIIQRWRHASQTAHLRADHGPWPGGFLLVHSRRKLSTLVELVHSRRASPLSLQRPGGHVARRSRACEATLPVPAYASHSTPPRCALVLFPSAAPRPRASCFPRR